ncbi:MFS transporter [Robbsia andropogonis]|nr:MFS transporter [Robbsia andropogonis]MCP1118680.1 MFS transporter [Robbsia andropogonis]MCP1128147.1 MFS transporter [Robbsia andropogonis]
MLARRGSNLALVVAHVAGMIDLVALPVWIETLIRHFHYDAQRAGGLATTYLACAVLSCVFLTPTLTRLPGRFSAAGGFALAASGFYLGAHADSFALMVIAHAIAGIGVGCGLSVTHGAIGRTSNPHRLFAMSHLALAVFGVLYFATLPPLIGAHGGTVLFAVFTGLTLAAALALAVAFPTVQAVDGRGTPRPLGTPRPQRLARGCRSAIAGIVCMAINQAMLFSFVQYIGMVRGFGASRVDAVLVAVGLVNLLPPIFATLLQGRLEARGVAFAGAVAQAVLALTISNTSHFLPYAVATSLWVFAMIFTHTFLFGFLAKLDRSGRAVAYTPAMLMAGSAVGPVLGGALIVRAGFGAIGIAAMLISVVSIVFFQRLRAVEPAQAQLDAPAAH